jgi:hypothetical protein
MKNEMFRHAPQPIFHTTLWLFYMFAPIALLIGFLATANYEQLVAIFADDAFYYFRIAQNISAGLGSTFGGLEPTNGYHPLWQLALIPVFLLFESNRWSLSAVLLLQAFLYASFCLAARRVARTTDLESEFLIVFPLVALTSFSLIAATNNALFSNGMESALTMTLLFAFIVSALSWRIYTDVHASYLHLVICGTLLGLLFLSRLDSIFFAMSAVLLLLVSASTSRPIARAAKAAVMATPGVLIGLTYFATNETLFGTITPISGQAKALSGPVLNPLPLAYFARAESLTLANIASMGVVTSVSSVSHSIVFAAASGLMAFFILARNEQQGPRRALSPLLIALLIGASFQILYLSVASEWGLWPWYTYFVPAIMLASFPVVINWALSLLGHASVIKTGLAVASALVFAYLLAPSFIALSRPALPDAFNWKYHATTVASWINEHTERDAVVAVGDRGGAVAFHISRPIVQLEGLVESTAYLDALKTGRALDYIRARGVRYLVASNPTYLGDGGDGCRVIKEPRRVKKHYAAIPVCDHQIVYFAEVLGEHRHAKEPYVVWSLNPLPASGDSPSSE